MSARHRAWAEIDLEAIRHNVRVLRDVTAPAQVCAVVKADAYGHGAEAVGAAAIEAGATWLAVALVEEGIALREAGIGAPILVLAEAPPELVGQALAHDLRLTVYTRAGIEAVVVGGRPARLHLKVDTGMHRVGCRPNEAVDLARLVTTPAVLEGVCTHLAGSEDGDLDAFTAEQLATFDRVRTELAGAGIKPSIVHAGNSGGALFHPSSRHGIVRCGIAVLGYAPVPGYPVDLRPALSLRARVSHVKDVEAGEGVSYNLRYRTAERTVIATVPIGYADGVPRRLSQVGAEVLIGGSRLPIAGTVTMDQLMVDCGPDAKVAVGDEVVLIGAQGHHIITADDWAGWLGTISYEVLCGIGPRVPRVPR